LDAGSLLVLVDCWPERFGSLEDGLSSLASKIPQGGELVLDLLNLQAPSMQRRVFEGRISSFDPVPGLADQEIAFNCARVVGSLQRAGFVPRDCIRVPFFGHKHPSKSIQALLECGFAATQSFYAIPAERLWFRCEHRAPIVGSVLMAHGQDEAAINKTIAHLRGYLPGSWEILVGPESKLEAESWNKALTKARGESLWLLRGGDLPGEQIFNTLRASLGSRPVLMQNPDGSLKHGLSGLMLAREALFSIGPFPEDFSSDRVSGEEWFLRASASGLEIDQIPSDSPWEGPGVPPTGQEDLQEEVQTFFKRWEGVETLQLPGQNLAELVPTPPWVEEGRAPRISLCMIARNEERFLEGCLARVQSVVDEIILVDTGSTDGTIEIAKRFGAKVLHSPWKEDFATPRNLALEAASGDWILILDADELVEEESVPLLRKMALNNRACGYHIHFINDYEKGRTHGLTMVRMFRKLEGIHYQYRIHEQVIPSLMKAAEPLHLGLHPCEVKVIHFGYSAELIRDRSKMERNERIFKEEIEKNPNDSYILYKYGDSLRQGGYSSEQVISVFERAMKRMLAHPPQSWVQMPYAAETAALLGLEYAKREQFEDADRVLRVALKRFIPTPNLFYLGASLATHFERWDEGLEMYQRLLDFRGKVLVVPIQEGIDSWVAYAGMAACWMGKGDLERAEELLERARIAKPDWEVSYLLSSGLLLRKNDPEGALTTLIGYLETHGESSPIRFQGGLLLEQMGLMDQAHKWLKEAQKGKNLNPQVVSEALTRLQGDDPSKEQNTEFDHSRTTVQI
jgi:glycosyltransferase involved in cell wall biosynthesis